MTSSWKLTLNNAEDQQESWLKKLLSLLYKLLGYSLPLWKYSVRNLRGSVWGIFLLLLLVASFSFLEFSILWFFICLFKFMVLTQEWISYIYRLQFTLFSFAAIEYLLFFFCYRAVSHSRVTWQHGNKTRQSRGGGDEQHVHARCERSSICSNLSTFWWNRSNVLNTEGRNKQRYRSLHTYQSTGIDAINIWINSLIAGCEVHILIVKSAVV